MLPELFLQGRKLARTCIKSSGPMLGEANGVQTKARGWRPGNSCGAQGA